VIVRLQREREAIVRKYKERREEFINGTAHLQTAQQQPQVVPPNQGTAPEATAPATLSRQDVLQRQKQKEELLAQLAEEERKQIKDKEEEIKTAKDNLKAVVANSTDINVTNTTAENRRLQKLLRTAQRSQPLGQDRDLRMYWYFPSIPGSLFLQDPDDVWWVYNTPR